jgi:hypothetical protein
MKANYIPKPEMNKTEIQYAWKLESEKRLGEIKWYGFEKIKLKLSSLNCWYNIDFMVIDKEDQVKMIEIKGGHIWDDSIVKFKVACDLYPFIKFSMIQLKNKQWNIIREN